MRNEHVKLRSHLLRPWKVRNRSARSDQIYLVCSQKKTEIEKNRPPRKKNYEKRKTWSMAQIGTSQSRKGC